MIHLDLLTLENSKPNFNHSNLIPLYIDSIAFKSLELVVIFLAIKRSNSLEIALEQLILVTIVYATMQDAISIQSFSQKLNFVLV